MFSHEIHQRQGCHRQKAHSAVWCGRRAGGAGAKFGFAKGPSLETGRWKRAPRRFGVWALDPPGGASRLREIGWFSAGRYVKREDGQTGPEKGQIYSVGTNLASDLLSLGKKKTGRRKWRELAVGGLFNDPDLWALRSAHGCIPLGSRIRAEKPSCAIASWWPRRTADSLRLPECAWREEENSGGGAALDLEWEEQKPSWPGAPTGPETRFRCTPC